MNPDRPLNPAPCCARCGRTLNRQGQCPNGHVIPTAESDARIGLHDLWREAAEKRIGAGIDWPGIVLALLRHVEEAWDEGRRFGQVHWGYQPEVPHRPDANPYRTKERQMSEQQPTSENGAACPSTVTAHLGFKAERQLPCGLLAGHGGKHVFHIEWSDRTTAIRVIPPGGSDE